MANSDSDRVYRRSLRKAVRTEIRFGDASGLGDILLDSRDLSEGGAFIASDLFFDIGEELDLELQVPNTERTVRARGRIAWVGRGEDGDNPPGMGLQFIDLSEEDRALLTRFVEST
ncbi:MAG: PilZ domain-containing protein [Myxococcota bacterium]